MGLHGRGADETGLGYLDALAPPHLAVVALRAPIAEGGGYAWFANRGIGRPVAASIRDTADQVTAWIAHLLPLPITLFGFSGGTAMAGGLLLDDPAAYAGAVLVAGTLPFDAGLPTTAGRLAGVPVLYARGALDAVIPLDLIGRTLDYLGGPSAADLTVWESPGLGHGIDQAMAEQVAAWLALPPR